MLRSGLATKPQRLTLNATAVPIRVSLLNRRVTKTQIIIPFKFMASPFFGSFVTLLARRGYEGPMWCFATAGCLILQRNEEPRRGLKLPSVGSGGASAPIALDKGGVYASFDKRGMVHDLAV